MLGISREAAHMRKRLFNWQGQRFLHLWLEGEPGDPIEAQSQRLFAHAGDALKAHGLGLDRNVVRSRVYGRTREARDIVSAVRGKTFSGQARAATSSFISPAHFSSKADVALELYAMAAPNGGAPRAVTEHTPPQSFIRHLVWGPLVFLAGMTCETEPTLKGQYEDILPRAAELLKETGCGWADVVRIAFCLHKDEDPQALLEGVAATVPVSLENAEIEFVEGYSRPNKLVEIEITARR
jgi:enamine deaminase RidA (YjgF/YER057c/UK114 family)